MTLWMLWSVMFAGTAGVAGLALDRAAGGFGAPRRHIWMVALVASIVVPALLAARRTEISMAAPVASPIATPRGTDAATEAGTPVSTNLAPRGRQRTPASFAVRVATLDRAAAVVWIGASCALALVFGRSMRRLRRRRRAWTDTKLGDQRVLLSADDGPAVVGFARPSIVFPRWALALDAHAQELILRHESEHIRVGDPRTLLAAGLLLVTFPWNAGLWWLVRRLRMAMELDCDDRVIRSVGASHAYGLMLLAVSERHTSMLPLASSLASARPLLEERIDAMSLPRPRRPLLAALPFLAIAVVATTAATRAPRPASLRAPMISVQPATSIVPSATLLVAVPAIVSPEASTPLQPVSPTPAVTEMRLAVAEFAAQAAAWTVSHQVPPDRAAIAALATEHAGAVVRGEVAADYIVMVLDASDKYVWSTSGVGGVAIEVAGDVRAPSERRVYDAANGADVRGGGLVVRQSRTVAITTAGGGLAVRRTTDAAGAPTAGGGGTRGGVARSGGDPAAAFTSDSTMLITLRDQLQTAAGGARGGRSGGALDSTIALAVERRITYSAAGDAGTRGGGGGVAGLGSSIDPAYAGGAPTGAATVARGGGGGGRASNPSDIVGMGGGGANDLSGVYGIGAGAGIDGLVSTNQASVLEDAGGGMSGIQGLLSTSVSAAETFTFRPGELAPTLVRVVVVHLAAGVVWTGF